MTPELQILLHARELVAAGWTQGEFARDERGKRVSPFSAKAVSFSTGAALDRAGDNLGLPVSDWNAARRWLHPYTGELVEAWNDVLGRTQAEAVGVFDAAIADARRAG
jgi:hypothetical protein